MHIHIYIYIYVYIHTYIIKVPRAQHRGLPRRRPPLHHPGAVHGPQRAALPGEGINYESTIEFTACQLTVTMILIIMFRIDCYTYAMLHYTRLCDATL